MPLLERRQPTQRSHVSQSFWLVTADLSKVQKTIAWPDPKRWNWLIVMCKLFIIQDVVKLLSRTTPWWWSFCWVLTCAEFFCTKFPNIYIHIFEVQLVKYSSCKSQWLSTWGWEGRSCRKGQTRVLWSVVDVCCLPLPPRAAGTGRAVLGWDSADVALRWCGVSPWICDFPSVWISPLSHFLSDFGKLQGQRPSLT